MGPREGPQSEGWESSKAQPGPRGDGDFSSSRTLQKLGRPKSKAVTVGTTPSTSPGKVTAAQHEGWGRLWPQGSGGRRERAGGRAGAPRSDISHGKNLSVTQGKGQRSRPWRNRWDFSSVLSGHTRRAGAPCLLQHPSAHVISPREPFLAPLPLLGVPCSARLLAGSQKCTLPRPQMQQLFSTRSSIAPPRGS